MVGFEILLARLSQAVVVPAVKRWLADRQHRNDARMPLSELINRRLSDRFSRRKFEREIEAMADAVAQRLAPLEQIGKMPEHERRAALDAVVDTFTRASESDEVLLAADTDADKLAAAVRAQARDASERAGLGDAGARLYDAVLDECCVIYVQVAVHLGPFVPRAAAEILSRTTRLGEQLEQVLDRIPPRSLDAPFGVRNDEQFRQRYLTQISTALDEVEIFGVDVRNYRPSTAVSMAYISLAVKADEETGRPPAGPGWRNREWRPGLLRTAGDPDAPAEDASVRVEQALSRTARTLVRGEAGSGKTTLLRWLAVTSARSAFTADLSGWNGYVPFLVVLRRYADSPLPGPDKLVAATAEIVAGQAPSGWAHRQLACGRALLLVDGVDELRANARRRVRDWLRQMLAVYPEIQVVVTSRPAAAAERWLSAEGFASTMLERMTPSDVRALICHWHRAVAAAGDLPCSVHDLPKYESALIGRLDANTHLHALATSPLLCAMLCALNLDRRTHLPRDRMSLYSAAVDLLLERRDTERDITSSNVAMSGRDSLQLMQYLAGKMSINNETETEQQLVVDRLAEKLAAMPQVDHEPISVFEHLLHRCGLIREPVPGRVDFVHRTFQEFLTALETADRADIGMLVEKAHRDSWRDIVVMAAGHANARVREELITRILDRADNEPSNRRTLRLLAAACLETVPALAPPLLDRIRRAIDALVPPRTIAEARSLASVGESLLPHLPRTVTTLSAAAAAGTIRAAALVNGSDALSILSRYGADPRSAVQQELARVWEYFDPDEYAVQVLAATPLDNGHIEVTNPVLLPAVRHLRHLTELTVTVNQPLDLAQLDGVPHLRTLLMWGGTPSRLDALHQHSELRIFRVMDHAVNADPADIAALTQLSALFFFRSLADLNFLRDLQQLERLGIGPVDTVHDFSPINDLPQLTFLSLVEAQLDDYKTLAILPQLTGLALINVAEPVHGFTGLIALTPKLDWLRLTNNQWIRTVSPLAELHDLSFLDLHRIPISDLTPLAGLRRLQRVYLTECDQVCDLTPLASLPNLLYLDLRGVAPGVDLSPLSGYRRLTVYLYQGQRVCGTQRLAARTRLKHLPRR
jgi:hypothetical protein